MEESYWSHRGKYQKLYEQLFATLVPAEGEAPTRHGEMLRLMSLLYNAFHRNEPYLAAQYGYPLLTLVQEADSIRAAGLASQIATGVITAVAFEEFADWVILYVASRTADSAPVVSSGMILVAITDGDLQGMAMAQLGRLLSAEELLAIAQELEPDARAYVAGYVRVKIQQGIA